LLRASMAKEFTVHYMECVPIDSLNVKKKGATGTPDHSVHGVSPPPPVEVFMESSVDDVLDNEEISMLLFREVIFVMR